MYPFSANNHNMSKSEFKNCKFKSYTLINRNKKDYGNEVANQEPTDDIASFPINSFTRTKEIHIKVP